HTPTTYIYPLSLHDALPICRKSMHHSMLGVVRVIVCVGLVLFIVGCGEDTRYSGNTQYLGGGVYGGAAAGPPRDTVSYWDGDSRSEEHTSELQSQSNLVCRL